MPGRAEGHRRPAHHGNCLGSVGPFPRPPISSGSACAEPAGRRIVGWEMAAAGSVAVATAAEYSGPVAAGSNLSSVNCGPSSGAGPGPGPGSWSRSLDRALEEAAVTGVLSLSGRKLREFPRGAANHDLTDTTRAGERHRGLRCRLEARGAAGGRPGRWGISGMVTATGPIAPGQDPSNGEKPTDPTHQPPGLRARPRARGEAAASSIAPEGGP